MVRQLQATPLLVLKDILNELHVRVCCQTESYLIKFYSLKVYLHTVMK